MPNFNMWKNIKIEFWDCVPDNVVKRISRNAMKWEWAGTNIIIKCRL